MPQRLSRIAFIGYPLIVLYSVFILINLYALRAGPRPAILLILFYGFLIVCSVSVIRLQDWGRRYLVVFNGVMCLYYLSYSLRRPEWDAVCYFLVHLIILFYFIQDHIKASFLLRFRVVRKSILVVDDDRSVLRTVQQVLLSKGFSILTASTGEKGLEIARDQKPDLIILDVILPGIKGRDLCARLKEDSETMDIPIIFLSAKDSPDDVRAELEAGALAHLMKPIDPVLLFTEVKKILGA